MLVSTVVLLGLALITSYTGAWLIAYCIFLLALLINYRTKRSSDKKLRQSEEQYISVVNNLQEVIFQTNSSGIWTYLNPAWTEITGYTVEESIGKPFVEFVHPADRKKLFYEWTTLISRERESGHREVRYLKKDGGFGWMEVHTRVLVDQQGRVVGITGTCTNITHRRRVEELLQASAEATNRLLTEQNLDEAVRDVLEILGKATGADRVYLFENGYGDDQPRMVSKRRYEWCKDAKYSQIGNPLLEKCSRQPGIDRMMEQLSAGKTMVSIIRDLPEEEQVFFRSIGVRSVLIVPIFVEEEFWGQIGFDDCREERRWSRNEEAILLAAAGSIGGALRRKRSEDALQKALEDDFRNTVENSMSLVFKMKRDETGRMYCSFFEGKIAQDLGIDTKWMIGKTFHDAFPRSQADFLVKTYERAFQGERLHYELEARGRMFFNSVSPTWENGRVVEVVGSTVDITERKIAERALQESEEKYRRLIEYSPEAIAVMQNGVITYINASGAEMFGVHDVNQILGKSIYSFILPEYRRAVLEKARGFNHVSPHRMREIGKIEFPDLKARRVDGEIIDVEARGIMMSDNGAPSILVVGRDVTRQRQTEEMMRQLAYHDVVTGLPNRRLFEERLSRSLLLANRSNTKVAVLFLDLDRFKMINDTLSHSVGDLLLKSVADRLKSCVRESDTVSRQGGDEFAVILDQISDIEDVGMIAKKIIEVLSHPFDVGEHELRITSSIGVALYPDDGHDTKTLMKHADTAMYRVKDNGKNNFQFYRSEMNEAISRKMMLENGLRKALDTEEFVLYYQPQIDMQTGEMVGVEALIRWNHPTWGLIPPGDFIPLTEETGLIIPIGEWVLRTACRQMKEWTMLGYQPVRVSINLSPLQFQQNNIVELIAQVLHETGLAPEYLGLEITEGIAVYDMEWVIHKLQALKELGVTIYIDDFGTGYSSLHYLKKFPIDTLKIAQSFVRDISHDSDDAAIVTAIVAMAQSLKLNVIAEGVESEMQQEFLQNLGCTEMQGYLFGRPMPAEKVVDVLKRE